MLKDFAKSDNGDTVVAALCLHLQKCKFVILTHVDTVSYVNQVLYSWHRN